MRVKSLTLGQFSLVVMVYKFDEQGETPEQKMVVSRDSHRYKFSPKCEILILFVQVPKSDFL